MLHNATVEIAVKIFAGLARWELLTSRESRLARFIHSRIHWRVVSDECQWVGVRGWTERPTHQLRKALGGTKLRLTRFHRPDVRLRRWGLYRRAGFVFYVEAWRFAEMEFPGVASNPRARKLLEQHGANIYSDESLTYVDEVTHYVNRFSAHWPWQSDFLNLPQVRHILTQWDEGYLHSIARQITSGAQTENPSNFKPNLLFTLLHITNGGSPELGPLIKKFEVSRVYEQVPSEGSFPVPCAKISGKVVEFHEGPRSVGSRNGWFVANSAALHADSSVVENERMLIYEHGADPSWEFVAGQWMSVVGSNTERTVALLARRIEPDFEVDEAISLTGRASANWYHAISEYLPRVLEADQKFPMAIPVIANDNLPQPAKDLLAAITPRKILYLRSARESNNPQSWCRVRRLHFRSPTLQLADHIPRSLPDAVLEVDAVALADFRRKVKSIIPRVIGTPPKVFLQRYSHRSLTNQQEIVEVARSFGYEPVDAARLSLKQQVELISGASHVVSPGGAIAGSYLFLPSGATVIGLASRSSWDFPLGAITASFSGSRFEQFLGSTVSRLTEFPTRREWIQSDYTITRKSFQQFLASKEPGSR